MKQAITHRVQMGLDPGITPAGAGLAGVVWNILGHTYDPKAESANAFAFETYDQPGSFVPPHLHPTQDEFVFVIENGFTLYLDGRRHEARAGDLVRMSAGTPHGYHNPGDANLDDAPTRAPFWVSLGRRLRELFDVLQLHDLDDPLAAQGAR